jgi:hypothetical protein
VSLPADEVLAHIATTLRTTIGPAVADPFPKTQAFMAAVILEKLAAQLRATARRDDADRDEAELVVRAVEAEAGADPRTDAGAEAIITLPPLRAALDGLRTDCADERWSALVRALYSERDALGSARFERMLGHVRQALRARLDRVLVYAA